ncbi:MAG: class I SAM-dependent methyltransferase [Betaproteobacteria bacterium]|nr:class I SAM-dependent methyltransferase [Betaproteobacteria bacterium]
MDLSEYRGSTPEKQRTADLLRLMPDRGQHALDIGARDGHFSRLMADRFGSVVALDLNKPQIDHPKIQCIQASAEKMDFPDGEFDFVFCAEVLEHIPMPVLQRVCTEVERVASDHILIGVPYKQDIRLGRVTCYSCGKPNPPWGHVNSFDQQSLLKLFPRCELEAVSFVGETRDCTNVLSTALMDFAGNPYGDYGQEEPCIYCGATLKPPPQRNLAQQVATKLAFWLCDASSLFAKPHGNWMHMVLRKRGGG